MHANMWLENFWGLMIIDGTLKLEKETEEKKKRAILSILIYFQFFYR